MANNDYVFPYGSANEDRPSRASSDGTKKLLRTDLYGDLQTLPMGKPRTALADEGSYYVATNPTPGTAIAGTAAADGVDDTEALIYFRNTNSTKRIVLDYLRLLVAAAGTNGTNATWVSKVDTGSSRYTSGGSSITPVNPNMASSNSPSCSLYFGAIVLAAASSDVRLVSHGQVRSAIKVVGDTYTFDFGGPARATAAIQTSGSSISHAVVPHVPVVLGPDDAFYFQINAASQSVAAQFQFELGFWER